MQRLLKEIEHGQFDAIVVTDIDRIARDISLFDEFEALLKQHQVNLYCTASMNTEAA